MNWLDILIIAILLLAVLWGFFKGLIGIVLPAIGSLIGSWLAGQYADDLGGMLGAPIGSLPDTIVSSLAYPLIIVLTAVVVYLIGKIARPFIVIGTLGVAGMIDKIGGIIVGLLLGLAVSCAVIVGLARLTYDFDIPPAADMVADITPRVENSRESLESALGASNAVSAFLTVRRILPDGALGFIPNDFQAAVDILETEMGSR